MTSKMLNSVIGHIASVLTASAIIMWSVFNFWLNLLTYRVETDAQQTWDIAAMMVVVTCIVPFLLGLWLLVKTLGTSNRKNSVNGLSQG